MIVNAMIFISLEYEVLWVISSFITCIFILWYDTTAVVEYGKIVGLDKILSIEEYNNYILENYESNYPEFLSIKKNNFLTRLLACPFCLGFWLCLIASNIIGWYYFSLIYLISLLQYFIIKKVSHGKWNIGDK